MLATYPKIKIIFGAMKVRKESEKISLVECRKLLGEESKNLSDEEILRMRNWLYKFTEITFEFLELKTDKEVIQLKEILKRRK